MGFEPLIVLSKLVYETLPENKVTLLGILLTLAHTQSSDHLWDRDRPQKLVRQKKVFIFTLPMHSNKIAYRRENQW